MAHQRSTTPSSPPRNRWDAWLYPATIVLIVGLAVMVAVITFMRLYALMTDDGEPTIAFYIAVDETAAGEIAEPDHDQAWAELSPEQIEAFHNEEIDIALHRVEVLREDAQDAVDSAQLVLSFLEGAGFLIALAAGLAAIYGFRSAREVRTELHQEKEEMQQGIQNQIKRFEIIEQNFGQQQKESREDFRGMQRVLDNRREDLDRLPDRLAQVTELERELENIPNLFRYLLQAYHELQLRNHVSAYDAVMDALKIDPKNPIALYYAGWLELQYIPGRIDEGMEHLHLAYQIDPDWPSAVAAYGVVLRRKAMSVTGAEREKLFNQAEGRLRSALGVSPMLLDLNRESLWGPVAGIQQDRERGKPPGERDYSNAIQTYELAASVTPGSSYPRGNLSALYMWRYKCNPDQPEYEQQALDSFEETAKLAQAELALEPSDYYHVMDIAMSKTVLSQRRPERHSWQEAEAAMAEAFAMNPTPGMLGVTVRGWARLLEYCPDHWHELRERLQVAQRRFLDAVEAAEAAID
jgi:tetratricopeptide (TPR) repeat protein